MNAQFYKDLKRFSNTLKKAAQKEDHSYDIQAKVIRTENDIAWVSIPGGVNETPVDMPFAVKRGDTVRVRFSNNKAWIAGNNTAPPTDDAKAIAADKKAVTANKKAEDAMEEAKNAGGTAILYMTEMDEEVGIFVHPKGTPSDPTNSEARGVQITEDVDIIRNGQSVAEFGETARVGEKSDSNVRIRPDKIQMLKGDIICSQFSLPITKETVVWSFRIPTKITASPPGTSVAFSLPNGSVNPSVKYTDYFLTFDSPSGETGTIGTRAQQYDPDDLNTWFWYDPQSDLIEDGLDIYWTSPTSQVPTGTYIFRFHGRIYNYSAPCYVGCYPDMSVDEVMFAVGNGTEDRNRSNALSVDWAGNLVLKGNIARAGNPDSIEISSFSTGWDVYNSSNKVKLRQFGNVVSLTGQLKNTKSKTLNTTGETVFSLPTDWEDWWPPQDICVTCHGSTRIKYLIRLLTDGSVKFERATKNGTAYDSIDANGWWPFHITWIADPTYMSLDG